MIRTTLESDYAVPGPLQEQYREWIKDPMTMRVLETLHYLARAYAVKPAEQDSVTVAVALGEACGRQFILDKALSLDTPMASTAVVESFDNEPAE